VYTETVPDGTSSTISQKVSVTKGDVIDVTIETAAEGSISALSITSDDGQEKTYIWDGSEWIELTSSADVKSVNGKIGIVDLNTDNIAEGDTNKYYSTSLANSDIDARVNKAFVDNLNVNAAELGGVSASNYVRSDINGTISNDLTVDGTLDANTISENGNQLLPAGVIVMWSGSVNSVPSGWTLCDGNNGTPNLTDRFIVGAGNSYSSGDAGGSGTSGGSPQNVSTSSNGGHNHSASIGTGGSHSHTINVDDYTLSNEQMPRHRHSYLLGRSFGADINANTGFQGNSLSHKHGASASTHNGHNHSVSINFAADHTHTIDIRPEYYALAYIMKL